MTWDEFKNYIKNTNTIVNPLDKILPDTRKKITGKNPPVIKEEPFKTKVDEVINKVKDTAKTTFNDLVKLTSRTVVYIILGGIAYILIKDKK